MTVNPVRRLALNKIGDFRYTLLSFKRNKTVQMFVKSIDAINKYFFRSGIIMNMFDDLISRFLD